MRTTTTNHIPKNVTRLEKEVYASLKRRARFVGLTIDELCRRAKIAPSTFSRWVNGHHSGLIFTIGQMDEILTKLEAEKFHTLEKRIHACELTISGACSEVDIPVLDYIRWIRKELSPDYGKLAELERFLSEPEEASEADQPSEPEKICGR
jgi:transcriptional regulator with XRE-family HTH domain